MLFFVSLTLGLAGCESLQLSNNAQEIEEVIIPELRGALVQGGQPAAGVRLRVSHREGDQSICEIPFAEINSDPDGRFLFPLVNGDLGKAVLDRVSNNWQMCVAITAPASGESSNQEPAATEWKQIWYDSHAGVMFGEKFTELACDLEKLPTDDGKKKSFFSRFKTPVAICTVTAKF